MSIQILLCYYKSRVWDMLQTTSSSTGPSTPHFCKMLVLYIQKVKTYAAYGYSATGALLTCQDFCFTGVAAWTGARVTRLSVIVACYYLLAAVVQEGLAALVPFSCTSFLNPCVQTETLHAIPMDKKVFCAPLALLILYYGQGDFRNLSSMLSKPGEKAKSSYTEPFRTLC